MIPNSEVIPADGYNFKKMERGGGRGEGGGEERGRNWGGGGGGET